MCSDGQYKGELDVADHQPSSSCKPNSRSFLHSPSPHHSSPRSADENPTKITVLYRKLEIASKAELLDIFLAVSFSLLKVTAGTTHVQEVINIIPDSNFDA